ncbi:hypothetical protein ACTXKH_07695 [Brachybacterium tyrofermentans]|uniref:hypothetical protein n=1 Tax=Brachybacterium tyrofermentans TaxID=47848 RepID=UPI003F8FD668
MNADQHPHEPQQPPPETRAPELSDPSAGMAPDAIQAADVDRDPQAREGLDPDKPARGVDWVRTSDLMSRAGGALSRRGIDFQAAMFQRLRSGIATGAKQVAAYAKRLPPLSAFGREEPAAEGRGLGRE